MIRKWSYITGFLNPSTKTALTTTYKLKTFRSTTRFKNYRIQLSAVARKKYATRYRRSAALPLSHIIKYWVKFYFKSRQLTRFVQNLNISFIKSAFPAQNVFLALLTRNNLPAGATLSTLPTNNLLTTSPKSFYYQTLRKSNTPVTELQTNPPLLNLPKNNINGQITLIYTDLVSKWSDDLVVDSNLLLYENLYYMRPATNYQTESINNQWWCLPNTHLLTYYKILISQTLLTTK